MKASISVLTILCMWFSVIFSSFAQQENRERTEIDFGVGSRIQMNNFFSGKYAEFFDDENYLLFNSSLNIALKKGWRIFIDLSYAKSDRKANRNNLLEAAAITGGYDPEKYYIQNLYNDFDSDMFETGVGIAYRFTFNRWTIEPSMGIGVYLFFADDYAFTAKEKGGYQIYKNRISFDDSYIPYMNAGVNVNYYLSKNKFFIGTSLNYQQTLMQLDLEHGKETWWGNEKHNEWDTHKGKLASALNMMVRIGFVFR